MPSRCSPSARGPQRSRARRRCRSDAAPSACLHPPEEPVVTPPDLALHADRIDTALEVCLPVVIQQDLRLLFTRDVFAADNPVLTRVLTPRDEGTVPRVLVFWDEGL